MIDIVKAIWEVGKGIFGVRNELQKAQRDRRDRLANYFSDLANLIESVAASLRIRQYPHGSCAQLHTLAELMSETVKDLVDPVKADERVMSLMRSSRR